MNRRVCSLITVLIMLAVLLCACAPETAVEDGEIITKDDITVTVPDVDYAEQDKGVGTSVATGLGGAIATAMGDYFGAGIFADLGVGIFESILDVIFNQDSGTQQILDKLDEIEGQIAELSLKIDKQTEEIKKAISDSELSSDLRLVNEKYAQIDRLYDDYTDIMNITDEAVRERELNTFYTRTVPAADLRSVITTCGSYLTKSSSGTDSLCNMYYTSCRKTYAFEHQMAEGINAFYQYHAANIMKGLVLFANSCQYRAEKPEDPNDTMMLNAARAIEDVEEINSSMVSLLHIDRMTNEIKYTGTDALGKSVTYYVVRANSDETRYVLVDNAYAYSDFYGKPSTSWYFYQPGTTMVVVDCIQSKKTTNYDRIMSESPMGAGQVLRNAADAEGIFGNAAENDILGYLRSNGIPFAEATGKGGAAFVFADTTTHPSKKTPTNCVNWGLAKSNHKGLSVKESYYLQYFLTNSESYKSLKDAEAYYKKAKTAEGRRQLYITSKLVMDGMEKSATHEYANGNKQKLVCMDYCVDAVSEQFAFPMYLVYRVAG